MATISTINIGSIANDGTGDTNRAAFQKANTNFAAINTDLETAQTDITALDTEKQPLDADLTALAAFTGIGFLVRTTDATYAARTITGTSGQIDVANGNGVSGNPTLSLPDSGVTAASYVFPNLTIDTKGRVTAASNGTQLANSIDVNGQSLTSSSNGNIRLAPDGTGSVVVESGEDDATAGPTLDLYRNSSSLLDNDELAEVLFSGENGAGGQHPYGKILGRATAVTDGSEDGQLDIAVSESGTFPTIPQLRVQTNITRITASNNAPLAVNRQAGDGTVVAIQQGGNTEGSISVSGSVVSYNSFLGAHVSRLLGSPPPRGTWLQTTDRPFAPEGFQREALAWSEIAQPGSQAVCGAYLDEFENEGEIVGIQIAAVGGPMFCRVKGPARAGDLLTIIDPGVAGRQGDDIVRSSTCGKVWCGDDREDERMVSVTLCCG